MYPIRATWVTVRISECGVERHSIGIDFEIGMCSATVHWVFGKRSRIPVPVDTLRQRDVSDLSWIPCPENCAYLEGVVQTPVELKLGLR